MSRIRQIKPSFFKHADLYDAEVSSGLPLRIAFAGLWTVADRRGVFPWSRNIKPDVLPYDPCDMLAVLDALAAGGFVTKYEVDGKPYGIIPTLGEHQHFHRDEKANALPAPCLPGADTVRAPGKEGAGTAVNGRVLGIGYQGSGIGDQEKVPRRAPRKVARSEDAFNAAWSIYPRRAGGNTRADALKAWNARVASGVSETELHDGTARYAAYCQATGKVGTEFVKQGSTFYGPSQHWKEAWEIPPPAIVATNGRHSAADAMSASMQRIFTPSER